MVIIIMMMRTECRFIANVGDNDDGDDDYEDDDDYVSDEYTR